MALFRKILFSLLLILFVTIVSCSDEEEKDPIVFRITCTGGQFNACASADLDFSVCFGGIQNGTSSYEFISDKLYIDYLEITATRDDSQNALAIKIYRDEKLVKEETLSGSTLSTEQSVEMSIHLIYEYDENDTTTTTTETGDNED